MVKEDIVIEHKKFSKGIEVDKVKIDTIAKLPPLILVKWIRSFLGDARFYKQVFCKISKPLCNLLEKDTAFKFDDSCLESFQTLKEKLVTAPIITTSD